MVRVEVQQRNGVSLLVWLTDGDDGEQAELAFERSRLVRLCAHLTGNVDVAEDLAQETLLEAWRNRRKLRDPAGRDRWLTAIARNVCRRWARSQGRDLARLAPVDDSLDPADDVDLAIELERDELADLLDRALALLPAVTRQVLVEKYVHESSYVDIAERMGLSEGAVSMRLTRGKLQLRHLLATDLREEALTYGLYDAGADGWRETRVWCPECGGRRLQVRFELPPSIVSFRCPVCDVDPQVNRSDFPLDHESFARLIGGLTRPKTILNKASAWIHEYSRRALEEGAIDCPNCGRPATLHMSMPQAASPGVRGQRGLHVLCVTCGAVCSASFQGLVTLLPEVQRFWHEHARIRTLPEREVEAGGSVALVSRFESVSGHARLNVVSLRDTFEVIGIHGGQDSS